MEFKNIVFNAARDGKLRRLKLFLDHRPKEEVKLIVSLRTNGATPLLIAARNGYLNVLEYLIDKCNADIEQVGTVNFDGESIEAAPPIWCAAAAGHLTCVKSLITHGANVNSKTKTNSTPLRAACFDGHIEIVKYLVEYGADIEIANRHGHTCLMISAYKKHLNIADFLITNGAQVNRKSFKGNTALHDCAESGSLEIMKLLLMNGAIMDVDSYGMTPLKAAALSGHTPIVELITSLRLCTQLEAIEALELLGATFVDKKHDILTALTLWRKALNLRNLSDNCPIFKLMSEPNIAYDKAVEFTTVEQLDELAIDPDLMRMQSLLIRERILGPSHPDTSYYIRYRGAVYADSGNYDRCIQLWIYALDMQQKIFDALNTMTQSSLLSFVELFSLMMSKSISTVRFSDLFSVLRRAIYELEASAGRVGALNDHDLTNYNRTINIVLSFLGLLCRLKPLITVKQDLQLKTETYRLVKLNPRGKNGSSLLHMVCNVGETSFALFPFYEMPVIDICGLLLQVGHPVDVIDSAGNTPLHISASAKHNNPTQFMTLLENGAHLDYSNTTGKVALDLVPTDSTNLYQLSRLKYITLQCLCAQTINKNRIPFKGRVGLKSLEEFIQNH
ncbi:protein fem-1 homolog C-like [Oppia nitens]|uniref:protein fem-1 homolog C-like n=1 Tax=Oppia nitens TaxID=1686743 RepID=UPI0023DAB8C5|nr:protein fem-1 homolog C-like [Oppia nitens]